MIGLLTKPGHVLKTRLLSPKAQWPPIKVSFLYSAGIDAEFTESY